MFTKWAVFFVFPGRNVCLGLMNRNKAFMPEHWRACNVPKANIELLRTLKHSKTRCGQCMGFVTTLHSLTCFWSDKLLPQTQRWEKKILVNLNHLYLIDVVRSVSLNHFKIRVNLGFIVACYIDKCGFKQVYFSKKCM